MKNYLLGTITAIFVIVMMLGAVLAPTISNVSYTSTTIDNNASQAHILRYTYDTESPDYDIDFWYEDDSMRVGTYGGSYQGQAAGKRLAWACDTSTILFTGSEYVLLSDDGTTTSLYELGTSGNISSSEGTVTIKNSTATAVLTLPDLEWQYIPQTTGNFGEFGGVGSTSAVTIKDYPVATWGSFAGAYAYNEDNSLNYTDLSPTYTVTDGVFTPGDWTLADLSKATKVVRTLEEKTSVEKSKEVKEVSVKSVVDPSTGTLIDNLYYTFNGTSATVIGISSSLSSATSITVPDTVVNNGTTYNVTSINASTFTELTSLETISLSSNLTNIGNSAFLNCTNLALTSLPSGVTSIGEYAFSGCGSLALTSLPSGVTSIGKYTFQFCTNLALTSLPSGVTSIGNGAFQNCTNLALTSLPSGVTSIGSSAFNGCTNLHGILTIPSGVTSIGSSAFNGCTGYTGLILLGSPSFGSNSLAMDNVAEVLNFGTTSLSAGDYGLSADASVRDDIPNRGYIAPISITETVKNEGAAYDLLGLVPIVLICGLLIAAATTIIRHTRD